MTHGALIRSAILDAWAVISPVSCAGCGAEDRALCTSCRARLTAAPHSHVIPGASFRVTSALDYDDCVRRAIIAFKEQSRTDIARVLARALREAVVRAADSGRVELVSVPSNRQSLRSRGYDPVSVLVARARLPPAAPVLVRFRETASQKTLDRESRRTNQELSLRARSCLEGRRFLLVDDVVTTGSTLLEAARAITDASGCVVAAATLAATPQKLGLRPHDLRRLER